MRVYPHNYWCYCPRCLRLRGVLLIALLPSCTLLFEDQVEPVAADSGPELDGDDQADAGVCDPFEQEGCYVDIATGDPDLGTYGDGVSGSSCDEANDCALGMICVISGDGRRCYPLCSSSHQCVEGACFDAGFPDPAWGFCS